MDGTDLVSVPRSQITRWLPGGQAPVYNSGVDNGLAPLLRAYGNLDIHNGLDLLAVGARSGAGIYILDISNPNAPVLLATIAQTGYAQDVAFDAAGNLYVMSSSTETLRIWPKRWMRCWNSRGWTPTACRRRCWR